MQSLTLNTTGRRLSSRAVLMLLALLSPLLIYSGTLASMIAIWDRSDTFTHQYAILPISLWLIWRRRQVLMQMTPTPCWPALIPLAACGFAWMLGTLAGVQGVRQYAFVASIILVVVTLFGRRISWAIAFPLLFLLLAVPFGEVFIDPLINFTADFTVAAVRATGIPVLREGNSFVLPSGRWSVVEACSGVRYLIASVTLGLLYAYLSYRSAWRRAAFVLVSIAVPIVANGLRAYMIVMIGHLSDMTLAVGVDHVIYGWLFFGLVMFLMFWIGGFWTESDAGRKAPQEAEAENAPGSAFGIGAADAPAPDSGFPSGMAFIACIASVIACIAMWPIYTSYLERAGMNPAVPNLEQFQAGWKDGAAFTDWQAAFTPPNALLRRFFHNGQQDTGLAVYYYRNQRQGSSLISSANRLLPEKGSSWNQLSSHVRTETVAGRSLTLREEMIQNIQNPSESLLVWRCYWIDGRLLENDYLGKMLLTRERLLMRGDDGAALVMFAPYAGQPEQARQALRAFLDGNLAPLEATLIANKKP